MKRPNETNYPAHIREFLALKWAVTEKFADYLIGNKFEVITDNSPLTYILTKAKLDATSQRWVASLSRFDFSIKHKSGKLHSDADGLSRHPNLISNDEVKAICQSTTVSVPFSETLGVNCAHTADEDLSHGRFHDIYWIRDQSCDKTVSKVDYLLDNGFNQGGRTYEVKIVKFNNTSVSGAIYS